MFFGRSDGEKEGVKEIAIILQQLFWVKSGGPARFESCSSDANVLHRVFEQSRHDIFEAGIGSLIVISQRQFHSAEVYGLLIVVGLVGFAINAVFVTIEGVTLRRFPPRASYMQGN